ncbi:MAG: hypothetical protein GEV08_06235 [Acidimicrobiia bacterium]|nr:hypothetical protein [Acidimicrobiia bacterium]
MSLADAIDVEMPKWMRLLQEEMAAEDAARAELLARRELAAALEHLDPEWADPVKVTVRLADFNETATALLDSFAVVFRRMRELDLKGLYAATVEAQGDTVAASDLWHASYGSDLVTALNHRLGRYIEGDFSDVEPGG